MLKPSITINQKKDILLKFQSLHSCISEYTFTNLYLYQKKYNYQLIEDYDLFIKGTTKEGFTFLMPTSFLAFKEIGSLKSILKNYDFLYPIQEEWLSYFPKEQFNYSCLSADSDYLFSKDKLEHYFGRHLAPKRNLLKQFTQNYPSSVLQLTQENKKDAYYILDVWKSNKLTSDDDYQFCLEAIDHFETLELMGQIFYIEEKPVGLMIAELVNERMAVIHFSKADVLYKGIYQYMFHSFAKSLESRSLCINMQQDLGIESLRQSKLSYYPDKILKKWRVSLK